MKLSKFSEHLTQFEKNFVRTWFLSMFIILCVLLIVTAASEGHI